MTQMPPTPPVPGSAPPGARLRPHRGVAVLVLGILGLALLAVRLGLGRRLVWITSPGSARLLAVALILLVLANWAYLLAVSEAG